MNEEVQRLLTKAEDSLSDAAYLLDDERLEASVNRAYYAVFHAMQAALLTQALSSKTHSGVQTKFREAFIKTRLVPEHLNDTITNLFNLRQGSDYETQFEITAEDARRAHQQAVEFVGLLRPSLTKTT